MRFLFFVTFYLIATFSFAQTLHHQMISAQGGNSTTQTGVVVQFTVGQQSVTGNQSGDLVVQQGFQQSFWEKIIATNNVSPITTLTYPNPYVDVINFQFSQFVGSNISLKIYDALGRQVYWNTFLVVENKISVNLQELQSAAYFVQLSNNTLTYHTKIIKN